MVLCKATISLVKTSHLCHSAFIFVKAVKEYPRVNSRRLFCRQEYNIGAVCSCAYLSADRTFTKYRVCCVKNMKSCTKITHVNWAKRRINRSFNSNFTDICSILWWPQNLRLYENLFRNNRIYVFNNCWKVCDRILLKTVLWRMDTAHMI